MGERETESELLQNLKSRQLELTALLAECSSHWGFEDPIYRFYHQSFKVFYLQDTTTRIVRVLESLVPDCPLNPWFREIVAQGTGKVFTQADNADWVRVTRPIIEAFFHARFFLEMVVRYATLEAVPLALPSGYAALLHLYALR